MKKNIKIKRGDNMNLKKNISLTLILIAILLVSVSSINACEVNDNIENNVNLIGNHADIKDYRNIADLNYADYSTSENLTTTDNSSSDDNIIQHSSHIDNLNVIQTSNSENDKNKLDNIINVTDLVASSEYKIVQTSNNTFILTLADNTTLNVGMLQVFDLDSFKKVANSVSTENCQFDAIVIDFKNNLNLEFTPWTSELIKSDHVKNLIIRGNGAIISISNPNKNNENHFLNVTMGSSVRINNITIKGFNRAISNYGTCQMKNVELKYNKVDYMTEEDYGGAIRNWGILKCSDCYFLGNYAKYGGAIYNEKGSQSTFIDCEFKDNTGYCCKNKKYSLETNDGNNIYTSKGATCLVLNHNDEIKYINIDTETDYQNFLSRMSNIGYVKIVILNFTSNKSFNLNQKTIHMPDVENIYIFGNGASISIKDYDDSNEYKFIKVDQGQYCSIINLTISRFNTAIQNEGSISITSSHFINNKIDYNVKDDYGGAIYNDEGIITISDSTFEGGYAKYGGAIYNEKGIISLTDCNFISNTAYADGGAIYNNVGLIYGERCNFTNNNAKNGGSIFNHYGIMILNNLTFKNSVAKDDGGAIYNDFGKITIGNCTFIDSKADEGKEIYNYGEDAKCIIIGTSYVINDGILTDTLKVTSDAPNEVLRWIVRGLEVVSCIAMVLICAPIFSETATGVICFIGGGLLAGAEEVIEGVYLDHNFNIYNSLLMMVISGASSGLSGALTSWIGRVCFKVVNGVVTSGSETLFNALGVGIDFVGEVITEVLPRADFSNNKVPTTIIDLKNPKIPC